MFHFEVKEELEELEELEEWEEEQYLRNLLRIYGEGKKYFCPRKRKMNYYRHHRLTKYFLGSESKITRKLTMKSFRQKLKINLYKEEYYKPVNKDYKTYGWIDW